MTQSVLVVSGTGKQGRAVSRELLEKGYIVHSVSRNPSSDASKELQALGAVVHTGDLNAAETIRSALSNVHAVFLVLPVSPTDPETEIVHAETVIRAAQSKGVNHFIYSSAARTGDHESFSGWNEDYPMAWYWKVKDAIETMVRAAGFEHWTIVRPAFFMQNFCRPEVEYMFPELVGTTQLRVAFNPDTRLDLVDVSDIAEFATAALESPLEFSGREVALTGEKLTTEQMAEKLGAISGREIGVEYLSDDQATELEEQGHVAARAQLWQRHVGYGVDVEALKGFGDRLTPLQKALDQEALGW